LHLSQIRSTDIDIAADMVLALHRTYVYIKSKVY